MTAIFIQQMSFQSILFKYIHVSLSSTIAKGGVWLMGDIEFIHTMPPLSLSSRSRIQFTL